MAKNDKSSKMTIIHVLEPFASGVTTAVSSIANELQDYSHIVIHGSRNWTESAENVKKRFPAGVSFIEWKNACREINFLNDWKALWELYELLKPFVKSNEKTVVHLHSSKAGFLGRLACRLLGKKAVIYTPHCGAFLRTDIGSFKRKLFYFLEWLGGCFSGRVVGCGPSEGELFKKLGKKTAFVSNGVAIKSEQRIDNQEQCNRNLVSFSGITSFQKDPVMWNTVAAACSGIAKKEGFAFCWIGDGPLANELNRDYITVTGWKTAVEVEELLKKTAVFFSASAWEGLPYGVLEAMNSSCALLLRNVPGNRELVVPGENGWLFDNRENAVKCLEEMLKDRNGLASMGKRSSQILVKNYSLEQMGRGYKKIYNDMLEISN